jgi:asparagine synthase (glutamine-hydrolysing)
LRHRGPDDEGAFRIATRDGRDGYLAAARLAILDPSPASHQPMQSEDGQLTLIYNGEIYNHAELRDELAAAGARFRSRSDTEVVLAGYARHGAALWPRLRGMFAFALWDARQDCLWLVRDAMGIKPLYYVCDGERLAFASELRVLLETGAAARRIDPAGLAGFLGFGSVPEPYTLIKGVRLLPPGHALAVRSTGSAQPVRYAPSLHDKDDAVPTDARAAMTLGEVLRDTAVRHLQADVPVGLLLSGGVDSTALAVLLADAAPAQSLRAFTLSAPAQEAGSEESRQAAKTAALLGLSHEICTVSDAEALSAMPRFLFSLDQPSIDGLNTFLVCERVRAAGYKLLLSGLGGDELFSGYGLHRSFAKLWTILGPAARLIGQEAATAEALYRRLRALWPQELVRILLQPEARRGGCLPQLVREEHFRTLPKDGLRIVRALERENYLVSTLLHDSDVMSMAHGVELRVPLCDAVLWSQALSLGTAAQQRNKRFLVDAVDKAIKNRAAAARLLSVSQEKKRGFVLPLSKWMCGPLMASVGQRLLDADLVRAAGLCPRVVRSLFSVHRSAGDAARRRLTYRVFALYVLLSYVEQHGLRIE